MELPDDLRAQLASWQRVLLAIDAELSALTVQLQEAAPAWLPSFLGVMTWELLRREVGDWRRFHNRRQVASHTGLCPSEHSSGHSRLQGSITRHGNPRIRHLLVEAAWRLLRYQPAYHPAAKWREALLACGPARRKKIIVAIARQLAVDLWRLATGRATAEQLSASPPHSFGAAGRPLPALGVPCHARCLLDRAPVTPSHPLVLTMVRCRPRHARILG